MDTQKEILDFLQKHKAELESRFGVKRIGLFGSFAKNEQKPQSDVDILVEIERDNVDIFMLKNSLRKYLSENFDRRVDIAREKYLKPYAKEEILKDILYAF